MSLNRGQNVSVDQRIKDLEAEIAYLKVVQPVKDKEPAPELRDHQG